MKAAPLSAVIMIGPCGLPVTWVGIADASITLSPVREKQVYIILTHFDSQSLSLTTYLLSIERHWMIWNLEKRPRTVKDATSTFIHSAVIN